MYFFFEKQNRVLSSESWSTHGTFEEGAELAPTSERVFVPLFLEYGEEVSYSNSLAPCVFHDSQVDMIPEQRLSVQRGDYFRFF